MSIEIRCDDCGDETDEVHCDKCAGKSLHRGISPNYDCPMNKCTHNNEGSCNTKPEFRFNNSFADDGSPKLECQTYRKQVDELKFKIRLDLYSKMDTERNILTSS